MNNYYWASVDRWVAVHRSKGHKRKKKIVYVHTTERVCIHIPGPGKDWKEGGYDYV